VIPFSARRTVEARDDRADDRPDDLDGAREPAWAFAAGRSPSPASASASACSSAFPSPSAFIAVVLVVVPVLVVGQVGRRRSPSVETVRNC